MGNDHDDFSNCPARLEHSKGVDEKRNVTQLKKLLGGLVPHSSTAPSGRYDRGNPLIHVRNSTHPDQFLPAGG